jgi:hypothetical protein
MKKIYVLLLASFLALPAYAGPYADALTQCLSSATTGKDRKDLAKWFVAVMSLHPEIAGLTMIPPEKRESINKTTGALYTRLMTEDCGKELKAVIKNEGRAAAGVGFEFLGRLAMQELISNPNVSGGISGIEKYVDQEKIRKTLD